MKKKEEPYDEEIFVYYFKAYDRTVILEKEEIALDHILELIYDLQENESIDIQIECGKMLKSELEQLNEFDGY